MTKKTEPAEMETAIVKPEGLKDCLCGCEEPNAVALANEIGQPGDKGYDKRLAAWKAACRARCHEIYNE